MLAAYQHTSLGAIQNRFAQRARGAPALHTLHWSTWRGHQNGEDAGGENLRAPLLVLGLLLWRLPLIVRALVEDLLQRVAAEGGLDGRLGQPSERDEQALLRV